VHGIGGGDDWLQTLERQVAACDAMAVLIGKEWADLKDEQGNRRLDDPHDKVRFEISQALLRNLPIVPISIDGAAIPRRGQLPDNIMQLANLQAMPLRAESFPQDAAAIIGRLRVLLAKQRRHGIPLWWAALAAAAAAAAGIAAGPWLSRSGLSLWSVTLPGDKQLKAVEKERDDFSQRLVTAQRERDGLSEGLAAAERARDGFREGLATAQRERDEARREATTANEKIRELEARNRSAAPVSQTIRDCSDCPEMVLVPAGKFMMGSADGDPDEKPVHEVTIARPFAVGKYEVTFAEWDACVKGGGCTSNTTPSDQGWGKGRQPVINVSWNDAKEYVIWLSGKTHQNYRLLTEAEWEYAARAHSTSAYAWGDSIGTNNATCNGCGSQWDNKQTAPVGSFPANAFGLYDMHGNVWEWCEDTWHPNYTGNPPADGSAWAGGDTSLRVLRGGSWGNVPQNLHSALRSGDRLGDRDGYVGFRVARTL
jgi:formylglycine-generating enzyme required for sulfatase activity